MLQVELNWHSLMLGSCAKSWLAKLFMMGLAELCISVNQLLTNYFHSLIQMPDYFGY